ncbi:DUF6612 family protein [Nesterenkonia marinintestina]|uniref:DUF6612 family protein n=1 Tax=Nesterenkonia marinintestina TaxID=2979865 RepID=UPI0021BF5F7C|nr:DUF6612 family protein [Nesterenkonia sp. GX14115]
MRRTTTATTATAVSTAAAALIGTALCSPAALAKDAPPVDTAPDVLGEVAETAEELEDLHTELSLTIDVDAEYRSHSYTATMTGEGAADFSDGHYRADVSGDGQYESVQIYSDGERAFANDNAYGWYETPSPDLSGDEEAPGYLALVDDLETVEDEFELTRTGTKSSPQYTLRYSGDDREVFEAFEETFSLTWEGYRQADTEMEIEVVVDADSMHMTSFDFGIESETVWGSDAMTIEAQFSEFDEVGPIEVPSWVVDEAERSGQTDDWFEDEGIDEEDLDDGLGMPGTSPEDGDLDDSDTGDSGDSDDSDDSDKSDDSEDSRSDDPWASNV